MILLSTNCDKHYLQLLTNVIDCQVLNLNFCRKNDCYEPIRHTAFSSTPS